MIRLAAGGANSSTWGEVAARLHGATVEAILGRGQAPSTEGWDAALLLDPTPAEAEWVDHFLAAGKAVLLTAGPWLSRDLLRRWQGARVAVVNPDRYLP